MEDILFPTIEDSKPARHGLWAVTVFNTMSAAMGQFIRIYTLKRTALCGSVN
jgi:hypothetical protein